MKTGIVISLIILLANLTCFAQKRTSTLSGSDKAQMVRSILLDYEFLDLEERDASGRLRIPLSGQNLSAQLVPKFGAFQFDLFSPDEIDERTKTGFRYFAFGEFKSKRSGVSVTFGDYFVNIVGEARYSIGLEYEFRKVNGKWVVKQVSGWGSRSDSIPKKGQEPDYLLLWLR